MQNVNVATRGKCKCMLNPNKYPDNGKAVAIEQSWRRVFTKTIVLNCMKTCVCHQTISVCYGQAAQKEKQLNTELLINCRFRCGYSRAVTVHKLSYKLQHRIIHVNPRLDASHLCHNSLCVKVSHISMEPHSLNNNKQYCMAQNICFGHGEYPQCLLELKYKTW